MNDPINIHPAVSDGPVPAQPGYTEANVQGPLACAWLPDLLVNAK